MFLEKKQYNKSMLLKMRKTTLARSLSVALGVAWGLAFLASLALTSTSQAATYTGLGFDACTAPPTATMTAWLSSPYRVVGIYIGGVNRACQQPNLTSAWVSLEATAGWQFIPTYVGLQAPGSSCKSCTAIDPVFAAAEGTAAASDAAAQMAALGLAPGNPVYYDMEHYGRDGNSIATALTFLSAWTTQLHASGYVSGVYSSASSGINDLALAASGLGAPLGFVGAPLGFVAPDALWIGDWNKLQTTDDPWVPATLWASQQRLHQYQGGHNETYAGTKLNIDSDYLNGPVATPILTPPKNTLVPKIKAQAKLRGRPSKLAALPGIWAGSIPIIYQYQWKSCNRKSTGCLLIRGATKSVFFVRRRDFGHRLKVLVVATNAAGKAQAFSATTATLK